jgi:hypothetical protein
VFTPTSCAIAVFTFAVKAASLVNSPAPRLLVPVLVSVAQAEIPRKAAANTVANDLLIRIMSVSMEYTRRTEAARSVP